MKRKDIIEVLMEDYELSKTKATGIYFSFADMITGALSKGEVVDLQDLFKITVKRTRARNGRNPFNGKNIKIPARNRLQFKVKSRLKTAIQEEEE